MVAPLAHRYLSERRNDFLFSEVLLDAPTQSSSLQKRTWESRELCERGVVNELHILEFDPPGAQVATKRSAGAPQRAAQFAAPPAVQFAVLHSGAQVPPQLASYGASQRAAQEAAQLQAATRSFKLHRTKS